MHGSTLRRSLTGIAHMIKSPRDGGRWIRDKLNPSTPIRLGLPWVSWPAIDHLAGVVLPGMRVFEWGGGGSTVFWLSKGCHVTTVESSLEWMTIIQAEIDRRGFAARFEIRLVEAGAMKPERVQQYIREVHRGTPWDIVLVDGVDEAYLGRMDCLREVPLPGVVRPRGLLVLDDSWRDAHAVAPQILQGWQRTVFKGLGPCRPGVTQTDVYQSPT